MHVLYLFRIERVDVVDADEEDVLALTVHEMASTIDAPPKMFVGAAIQRVHALQDTGHMNTRLTAPHTDCGIENLLGEAEFGMDGMNPKHALEVQLTRAMVT